ncbi:NAD-dependent epimerase/dehydratase family protein [Actinomadura yumaensis]|uniref:NAD-dependent epimerase/dehydratase family protein n=1 Tax=Actinomadura yumaensis TaxID=111807 RepID=UPI00360B4FCF
MHVFLAGATGVLGRRIVPRLLADGHRVTALVRDDAGAAAVEAAGATPARADAFDAGALARAVAGAAPDAVMHQLTDLARGDSSANAHMRRTGTRNLVDAAKAAGVRRVVAQSIAWVYEPGPGPADEATPLDLGAAPPGGRRSRASRRWRRRSANCPSGSFCATGCCTGRTPGTRPGADGRQGEGGGTGRGRRRQQLRPRGRRRRRRGPRARLAVRSRERLRRRAAGRAGVAPRVLPGGRRAPASRVGRPRDGAARGASNRYARERLGWTPAHPVFSP